MDFICRVPVPTRTHYYQLLNPAGLTIKNNGQAAEAYNPANWTQYVFGVALPDGRGVWKANMPAGLPAGIYTLLGPYEQAGATTPAATDEVVGAGASVPWTGTAIRTELDLARPSDVQIRFVDND